MPGVKYRVWGQLQQRYDRKFRVLSVSVVTIMSAKHPAILGTIVLVLRREQKFQRGSALPQNDFSQYGQDILLAPVTVVAKTVAAAREWNRYAP